MRNFKKYCLVFFVVLSVIFCGCNGNKAQDNNTNNSAKDEIQKENAAGDNKSDGDSEEQSGSQDDESGEQQKDQDDATAQQPGGQGDNKTNGSCKKHADGDDNGVCDVCAKSVLVSFDFYSINDLHGKLADSDSHPGVDELTTYLKNARANDENAVFLSAGDMWQGSPESNLTNGLIMTDWMNELDFAAMAMGNHEYDWGETYIEDNEELAEFPFLAINIFDRDTNKRVDYCEPSVMVEGDGVQVGIIGAIGDSYNSIAVDKCQDVYFKVGSQLTSLVKAESERLRKAGADFIVYVLHDGYGSTNVGSVSEITSSQLNSYYDISLSGGYVDLVFEAHTHQGYMLRDAYGVYHLQNRGDNKGGISHAEVTFNIANDESSVNTVELISTSTYSYMEDDPIVENLLDKYSAQIDQANQVLGYNRTWRSGDTMRQLVADLYYEVGMKEWGDQYKIVLGGGFMSVRSPYNLSTGEVTYGDLQSLFPFDNQLTLCSIKGSDLKSKFFETNNSNYFIQYGDYGESVRRNIDLNATYYIIVDSYTAYYAYNNLTVVEKYTDGIYARDFLAEYVKNGGLS